MTNEPSYHRDTIIKLQEANALKAAGHYQEAVQKLQSVIADDPHCAPAYNNLGAIYFLCQDYYLSMSAYQAALDVRPDYLDAYYNLGLAQMKCQLWEEAMVTFKALLSLNTEHPGAKFQLANLYLRQKQYDLAKQELLQILVHYPQHFESLANLALCYLHLGQLDAAAKAYWQALEINPDDADILFNLGVIHMQQGYAQEALDYYKRTVKSDPDYFDAHYNLAAAYLMRRHYTQAEWHFQEALRLKPNDAVLKHTLQIIRKDQTLKGSAPQYIQSLFDSYADHYEPHLLNYLDYRVPQKLLATLQLTNAPQSFDLMLDLGCGTGLCGPVFKPWVKEMWGVDLSPNMLELAELKQTYSKLVTAEAASFLGQHQHLFSLIVAADVLVYFGELEGLLAALAEAMQGNGCFVFNVEAGQVDNFQLTSSGRFAHSLVYLNHLAITLGFEILLTEETILRQQAETPVKGYVCVWRRLCVKF